MKQPKKTIKATKTPTRPINKKKLIKQKKWTIEMDFYDDGTSSLTRKNDGFEAYELLGLTTRIQLDILDQLKGLVVPTVTNRIIIK